MNHIDHLMSHGYLVLHKDDAAEMLSKAAYRELMEAVEQSLKKRNGTPLSQQETEAMRAYFEKKMDGGRTSCPTCGSPLRHQGGCLECSNPGCGWAACG